MLIVKFSQFLMCFTIYYELNDFSMKFGKRFVGASAAPANLFVGAGEPPTPLKIFFVFYLKFYLIVYM